MLAKYCTVLHRPRLLTSALLSLAIRTHVSQGRRRTHSSHAPMATIESLVEKLESVYPRGLAGSWDNTGLLLSPATPRYAVSSNSSSSTSQRKVLLCIDLTTAVCDEALSDPSICMVVAYHPIIFRGLKSITTADTQQRSLLRLAQAGIAVHCPHTAVDAVRGGVNDDLVNVCLGTVPPHPPVDASNPPPSADAPQEEAASELVGKSQVVEPAPSIKMPGFEDAGYGRVFTLSAPISLDTLVRRVKVGLGVGSLSLVRPRSSTTTAGTTTSPPSSSEPANDGDETIRTLAVCAGSGSSVLKPLLSRPLRPSTSTSTTSSSSASPNGGETEGPYRPDYIVTGEMSHHDALHFAENNVGALIAGHSNTERPYLTRGMSAVLERVFNEHSNTGDGVAVVVSEVDRDPILIV